MAITAAVTTVPSSGTISPNQRLNGLVTITNGNSTPVEVLSVSIWAARTTFVDNVSAISIANNECNILRPGNVTSPILVANSNTCQIPFQVIFQSPRFGGATLTNPNTQQYDIGATVYTSDESVTNATVQTVTITSPGATGKF